ncbi:uncharacterized protein PHACADRAFT_26782 [Phanerochaete carnosa HHB-10118-sp]|uniref:Uncharacterized protein n=1 Tax=Phanerochaete carnosa (strain HHB-10118-sp) TaxID=650164 RepID=K5WGN4_PHACS|nr:uncharacterized protein PHACADRAFT_26782 [Phanerochaete carnosa HHB-10118-sp]EKM58264.1 hypothetical protein PHACADRAFT_26782 [Phanerochaete carnosa HHB-10118-sp]
MSPTKGPVRDVKVHVPRHNSQRIGPRTVSHVESIARKKKKRVEARQTAYEPAGIMAQAIESASEWNSLLMTARAERGPQWDIGTQQFLVDEYSSLYYDPTLLREYEKEGKSEESDVPQKIERQSMPPPEFSPQMRRGPPSGQGPSSLPFNSPRHPSQMAPGMSFANMGVVPTGQFYGNGDMGPGPSPMRMGAMGMPVDPMGGMGGMAGMNPMANMGGMGGMPGMPGMGGMGDLAIVVGTTPDLRLFATSRAYEAVTSSTS